MRAACVVVLKAGAELKLLTSILLTQAFAWLPFGKIFYENFANYWNPPRAGELTARPVWVGVRLRSVFAFAKTDPHFDS